MTKPIVIGYWNLHGLGSSIRFMLEIVGADYVNELYTPENANIWFENKKKNLDVPYPNIPYLIDGDVKLTEHLPILRYLARKYDLYPKTEQEIRMSDQTETFITDVRSKMVRIAYAADEAVRAQAVGQVSNKLSYLNKVLEKNEYIAGSKLTYVDILVFDVLLQIRALEASLINENTNFCRFIDRISKLDNIAKHLASDEYKSRPFMSLDIYNVLQKNSNKN